MSPFYAPFSLDTDGLDVCSDCGGLVSRQARALHDKVCPGGGKPTVTITAPNVSLGANGGTLMNKRAQERRDLFEKAEAAGVLEQYRTPGGRVSYKWHCTVCGAQGGGPRADGEPPIGTWWMNCATGHPYGCACGRVFSTLAGRAAHVRAMQRRHPEDGHTAVAVE
jgi:hypothetical protein